MAKWAKEHADLVKSPNFYDLLWQNRADYCATLTPESRALAEPRIAPNYERVLGDLHVLMNGALGVPFGDPLLQWITKAQAFRNLGLACDDSTIESTARNRNFHRVHGQLQVLSVHLAERIRSASRGFEFELRRNGGLKSFAPYKNLFHVLRERYDVGTYNLNYDTVALNAMPDAFVGFDREAGHFLPAGVLNRLEWNFVYHLHGSVHHRIRKETNIAEDQDFGCKTVWHEDLWQSGDTEDWQDARDLKMGSDGRRIQATSVVAGGWKLDQLQEEPFLTFYSSLVRHMHDADALMIGGYGFGDPHINSILENAIRARAKGPGRPPIVVLDWNADHRPTAKRVGDQWVAAMRHALRVPPSSFRDAKHRAETQAMNLPDRVTPGEFEESVQGKYAVPVSIWNQGFVGGAEKAEEIAARLDGECSAL